MRPIIHPVVLGGLFALLMAGGASAQPAGGSSEPAAQPTAGAGAPAPAVFRPKVREVRVEGTDTAVAGLGDTLVITLEPGDVARLWQSKDKLRLYLNARPIPALTVHAEPLVDQLRFVLARNEKNRGDWDGLLGAWKDKDIRVAVGLEDGPGAGDVSIRTNLFPVGRTVVVFSLGILVVVGMFALGRKTTLLRDPAPVGTEETPAMRTYSLGRTQMAWWTVMTVLALLALWWITGDIEPVSSSMLALMGIGAGTFLSSVLIDGGQVTTSNTGAAASTGFFRDILSEDGRNISLHRLQMAIWTVVVTVAFWTSVVKHLAMPELDPTLLGLLGISNGSYLGFKLR
jgi:hypothetical protein